MNSLVRSARSRSLSSILPTIHLMSPRASALLHRVTTDASGQLLFLRESPAPHISRLPEVRGGASSAAYGGAPGARPNSSPSATTAAARTTPRVVAGSTSATSAAYTQSLRANSAGDRAARQLPPASAAPPASPGLPRRAGVRPRRGRPPERRGQPCGLQGGHTARDGAPLPPAAGAASPGARLRAADDNHHWCRAACRPAAGRRAPRLRGFAARPRRGPARTHPRVESAAACTADSRVPAVGTVALRCSRSPPALLEPPAPPPGRRCALPRRRCDRAGPPRRPAPPSRSPPSGRGRPRGPLPAPRGDADHRLQGGGHQLVDPPRSPCPRPPRADTSRNAVALRGRAPGRSRSGAPYSPVPGRAARPSCTPGNVAPRSSSDSAMARPSTTPAAPAPPRGWRARRARRTRSGGRPRSASPAATPRRRAGHGRGPCAPAATAPRPAAPRRPGRAGAAVTAAPPAPAAPRAAGNWSKPPRAGRPDRRAVLAPRPAAATCSTRRG